MNSIVTDIDLNWELASKIKSTILDKPTDIFTDELTETSTKLDNPTTIIIPYGSSKPKHKFIRRARAHGRPPDGIRPKSDTSDQHDTSVASSHVFVPFESETMNVSSTETNLSENEDYPSSLSCSVFLVS